MIKTSDFQSRYFPKSHLIPQNDNTQSDFSFSKLTSNKMATGSVTSSQAILARFFSPPDKPLTHMSPMTVK